MIKIEIVCEPTEYAFNLLALMRGVGDAVLIEQAVDRGVAESQARAGLAEAMADLADVAAASPPSPGLTPATAEETPRRRGRQPRATAPEAAASTEPAPAISTGEERMDPQDLADEAAEAAAAKEASGGKLTLNDVRAAVKAYTDKYGHEAGVHDIRSIIGGPISEIPDDQVAISAAIAKLRSALHHGRPEPEAPKPEVKAEPKTESAPIEGGLFGSAESSSVAEQPKTATKDQFMQVCITYSKKFDPKMATDPMKSTMMQEDVNNLAKNIPGVDPKAFFSDPTQIYKVVEAVKQALLTNPFKRGA